jgi:hypothetical protein
MPPTLRCACLSSNLERPAEIHLPLLAKRRSFKGARLAQDSILSIEKGGWIVLSTAKDDPGGSFH